MGSFTHTAHFLFRVFSMSDLTSYASCVAGSSEETGASIDCIYREGAPHCCCLCHKNPAVLHWRRAHCHPARSVQHLFGGNPSARRAFLKKEIQQRFKMIKNGHHHQHQESAAAGKDAGITPGAAACSSEKRRRRIRVWCDGWWVSYMTRMLQHWHVLCGTGHVWIFIHYFLNDHI